MLEPYLQSVTPLLATSWGWILLFIFWVGASLFVKKSKSVESPLARLSHQIPLYIAFFLIFHRHEYPILFGSIYHTDWQNWIVYPALIIFIAGIFIALWARIHIGQYWSGIITLKEGHKVIDTGPYRFVRHPIYTGWILAAFGSALAAGTADAFFGVEIMMLAFIVKLHREERLLTAQLGDEYRRYLNRVPSAIFPGLGATASGAGQTIHSEAFNQATLRSDRYRAFGLLLICAAFVLMDLITFAVGTVDTDMFVHSVAFWISLAVYESILLSITRQAQIQGRYVRTWVWAFNTIIEGLLPTLALLGLTAAKGYMGPYRALVSASASIYFLFIILSTLRLSPGLCILSGLSAALGYLGLFAFTLHVAPNDRYRHFMPDRTYLTYALLLLGAGVVAAGVARRIRQHLVAALQEAETRRKLDRIEFDLNIARSIQKGLLPKSSPQIPGYDIAGWSEPADQTGEDYYDWMQLPDGRVIFTIADATGHGIGPALLIAACRAYFRAIATRDDPLERITQQVDALLSADIPEGKFITAAIALLDPVQNRLGLHSAGHAPIYFYSAAENRVIMYDADQPPLGIHSDSPSRSRTIQLSPGDALILVTDGLFECTNPAGQMLGMDRLAQSIQKFHADPAPQLIHNLFEEVRQFCQSAPQADDITVVVIKRV
jgi:serine phosphatase RsbU (regulator of sigma subunit)/protein-S-isoprenylcysteine O-methyltransferase Ste14